MAYKCILAPVKGEGIDQDVLTLASHLARPGKGQVVIIYVIEVPRHQPVDADLPQEAARGEEVLRQAERWVQEHRVQAAALLLQARDAGPAVVKEAVEQKADLVVVGLPYKQVHGAFTLGRAIPYILQHAPCPVLLLREAVPSEEPSSPPPPRITKVVGS
mgnify:CR=1 FL=1